MDMFVCIQVHAHTRNTAMITQHRSTKLAGRDHTTARGVPTSTEPMSRMPLTGNIYGPSILVSVGAARLLVMHI